MHSLIKNHTLELGLNETISEIIPYFIYWHLLFWFCKFISSILFQSYNELDSSTKSYWAASMVSSIHAVIIVAMVINAFQHLDIHDLSTIYITSPQSSQVNAIFLGYLLNDILACLYYNKSWAGWEATVIHHIVGLGCWYMMNDGQFGHVYGCLGLLTEITTPFVNQRFFFDKASMKSSKLYLINGLTMTVLWFIFRILMCAWLGYRLYQMRFALYELSTLNFYCIIIAYIVGYSLQLFWFSKIFKGALKVLRRGGKKPIDSNSKKKN